MRFGRWSFALLAATVSCAHAFGRSPPPYRPTPGPAVDAACIASARRGSLLAEAPSEVRGYRVTREQAREPGRHERLYLRKAGRALTDDEGARLWKGLRPDGLALGTSALYSSTYDCADVGRPSCLTFELWLCQTSLARLTEQLDAALARAGAEDGELGAHVDVAEAGGPRCKGGACAPTAHYSKRDAEYDPSGVRLPVGSPGAVGRCEGDGDCDGGGNVCHAWYLRGGAELAIYYQVRAPTFCGCVDGYCAWFEQ